MKVVLDLPNYATKKELNRPADVDTSYLAAKQDFVGLKAEVTDSTLKILLMFQLVWMN